jgi:hypothetical protein
MQSLEVSPPRRSAITPLTVLLCLTMVFFFGVLIFVYAATKRASPVMLDQQGHPLQPASEPAK